MSNSRMRYGAAASLFILALVVGTGTSSADWNPGDPAKWVQLPDLQNGMDVNASFRGITSGQFPFIKVLADDWRCNSTDRVTDIHIWGSWLNNLRDPNVVFKLSIHDDVPAGVNAPYSHPGQLRWEATFTPTQYAGRRYATASERFYDPNQDQIIGTDTEVWQYNFLIPAATAFQQEGTDTAPRIYWLDVQAHVADNTAFGWKTTQPLPTGQVLLDDAVFADTETFGGPPLGPAPAPVYWKDMHYPIETPYQGQSIDLAFVITPEPASMALLGLGALALLRRRR